MEFNFNLRADWLDSTADPTIPNRQLSPPSYPRTYAQERKPEVMQSPNASITRNPTMSVITTARVQRPRTWYDGDGMYQFGRSDGVRTSPPPQGTASVAIDVTGSAANASAVSSSSEIGASLTEQSMDPSGTMASFDSL